MERMWRASSRGLRRCRRQAPRIRWRRFKNDNFTHNLSAAEGCAFGHCAVGAVDLGAGAEHKLAEGTTFDCIRGLEYIRGLNQNSRSLRVDGANLSFGYELEAATYGCGHSPICEEVNRCVDAGICVVCSCGNSGFGTVQTVAAGVTAQVSVGVSVSISDPANADLCIAVGSVHKRAPHKYGVSYFSSKGPTLDGRQKPDLVAPGEKIYSCNADMTTDLYIEMSGTSMAAPHVSGAVAAFLSVRPDFAETRVRSRRSSRRRRSILGAIPRTRGRGCWMPSRRLLLFEAA